MSNYVCGGFSWPWSYIRLCMCFSIRMWSIKVMIMHWLHKIPSQRPSSALSLYLSAGGVTLCGPSSLFLLFSDQLRNHFLQRSPKTVWIPGGSVFCAFRFHSITIPSEYPFIILFSIIPFPVPPVSFTSLWDNSFDVSEDRKWLEQWATWEQEPYKAERRRVGLGSGWAQSQVGLVGAGLPRRARRVHFSPAGCPCQSLISAVPSR